MIIRIIRIIIIILGIILLLNANPRRSLITNFKYKNRSLARLKNRNSFKGTTTIAILLKKWLKIGYP